MQVQVSLSATPASWQFTQITLSGGAGNLLTAVSQAIPASIVPTSLSLVLGGNTYTDPNRDGTLTGTPAGSGTINYATGAFTITGGGSGTVTGTYAFYPAIPSLGLRNFTTTSTQYPLTVGFDQVFAYQIPSTGGPSGSGQWYNVSYYRSSKNPVRWSGAEYQQFWTVNYEGALWTTNGKSGLTFRVISAITKAASAVITLNSVTGFIVDDYVFINEVSGMTQINGLTGKITAIGVNTITVNIDSSGFSVYTSGGVVIALTYSGSAQDGIKWYDGDPTSGTGINPSGTTGWANFSPPLSSSGAGIEDIPAKTNPYYLVGCAMIVPYKDRLLFFAPYIQAADGSSAIQLQDTVLWSWNGTPYYTVDATGAAVNVPVNQTANKQAYYVNQTGFGGYLSAGIDQLIKTVGSNEDVLIVGFTQRQTRFVYTGNDLFPFLFYSITSELGSASTFSLITLDRGEVTFGLNGLILTSQTGANRIDLSIPDQVFQLKGTAGANCADRISASRDYYHEWAQFTFSPTSSQWAFPTLTLQYNYREQSWAIHYENFTCHGTYRATSSFTWATIPYATWADWNESWGSSTSAALFPNIIAGNPQGFVVIKGQATGEAPTGAITALALNGTETQITSYNHCVAVEDYLYFQSCIGSTFLNLQIAQVKRVIDANNFTIDIAFVAGTYLGLGVYTRLIQPQLQTKQFPIYWKEGRKVRVGVQKYLLDTTTTGQVTAQIFLSQDPDNPWTSDFILPSVETTNNALIYSQLLFTCPESTNLGLTQITQSINNPLPITNSQRQIWHRINTSLIGDTFQLGLTLNDAQMRDYTLATSEISLHAIQVDVDKGPMLA